VCFGHHVPDAAIRGDIDGGVESGKHATIRPMKRRECHGLPGRTYVDPQGLAERLRFQAGFTDPVPRADVPSTPRDWGLDKTWLRGLDLGDAIPQSSFWSRARNGKGLHCPLHRRN
jgi:hypothetical protein